ncbi:MAG: hypothetical protein WAW52_02410 [Methanothrix sp.]
MGEYLGALSEPPFELGEDCAWTWSSDGQQFGEAGSLGLILPGD